MTDTRSTRRRDNPLNPRLPLRANQAALRSVWPERFIEREPDPIQFLRPGRSGGRYGGFVRPLASVGAVVVLLAAGFAVGSLTARDNAFLIPDVGPRGVAQCC